MAKKVKSKQDIQEIINLIETVSQELKKDPNSISVRDLTGIVSERQLTNHGGLPLIKKTYFPTQEKDLTSIVKTKAQSNYISKLEKRVGQEEWVRSELLDAVKSLSKVQIKPYKPTKKRKINRKVNLVLSDLHFGSDIDRAETGNSNYGRVEESRKFSKIIKETIEYKEQHRDETELNVLLLGDLIQGNLGHDPRDGAPLTEQICRAIYLLSRGIALLSNAYPKVTVYVNSGNHGRNIARHPNRAAQGKWDSYETIIGYALKEIGSNLKNVEFVIPKTPFVTYEVFGQKVFATHGDTVLTPGYPGKAVKTGLLENQINKINASLKDSDEYSVFVLGHVHVGSIVHLSNGATLLTNGALVPTDEYAVSIGLLESSAGQYIFESVEGYAVGDCRFIKVGPLEDNDKSLDKIIKPFENI